MLINKVEECAAAINELSELRTSALGLNAFEKAVDQLAGVDALVTDFVSTVEEMAKNDFCRPNLPAEDIEKLKSSILDCAGFINRKEFEAKDAATLKQIFQAQKGMLTVLWKSTAKGYVEPICSYLGVIQSFAPNGNEISNLIKYLSSSAASEPNAEIVKTLSANAQRANGISNNFQMSSGVRAFLQKAKDGKATYDDITPEVSQWIARHNLGNKVKISF